MRNIRKTLKVKEVLVTVYDTVEKCEKTIESTISEVETEPRLPENCIVISIEVVEEKEVVYKMTPNEFVKHAIIVEADED